MNDPAESSKIIRAHRVYLSELAREIIGEGNDDIVLSSPIPREDDDQPRTIPVSTVDQALRRQVRPAKKDAKSKIKTAPFTPHDLRRTAGTLLAEAGCSQFLIGQRLNHTNASVTGIYNRYAYDKEIIEIANQLKGLLRAILRGK